MPEEKKSKPVIKRLSKSQRTHNRRMKQAARKESGISNPQTGPAKPAAAAKKQDPS